MLLNVCGCKLSFWGPEVPFGAFSEVAGFLLLTFGGSKASAATCKTRNVRSYNVTSRRVSVTFVAGEKQEALHILGVCL
jgi:hypothetical protein